MSSTIVSEVQARRNVNYLAALDFIISLGFGLILPLFPLYVKSLGGGGLEVGILFSSFVLTRAILATPFGNLSDRIGRKRLILIGSFLYTFLAILFTVPDTWSGLIFVRALQGVSKADAQQLLFAGFPRFRPCVRRPSVRRRARQCCVLHIWC